MTLASSIVSDASTVFTSSDDFAESVVYLPRHGEARTIDATVIRNAITFMDGPNEITTYVWQVHVINSATTGISGDELNTGGDAISLSPRDGQSRVSKSVTRIVSQDAGMLVLECQ